MTTENPLPNTPRKIIVSTRYITCEIPGLSYWETVILNSRKQITPFISNEYAMGGDNVTQHKKVVNDLQSIGYALIEHHDLWHTLLEGIHGLDAFNPLERTLNEPADN